MALVAAAALACLPASARAAISLGPGLVAKPASTSAGAHSAFTLKIPFGGDDVKDLTVELPPGQVANPLAAPKCSAAQLAAANCPAASQVGTVTVSTTITIVVVGITTDVNGSIYNVAPKAGEPARFGIVLRPPSTLPVVLPPVILQSAVELRNQPVGSADFGLNTVIQNIPNTASGLPTHINSMTVTLDGRVGKRAFMRNPTSCRPATTTFVADSYANTTATGTASYTPTKCGALRFVPKFAARVGSRGHTGARSEPPLTTVVRQGSGQAGTRNASIVLPHGIGATNQALARQCATDRFAAGHCPPNTVVGKATVRSPFLERPLRGPVSIVTAGPAGGLPRLGLDLRGPLHIQLFGSFTIAAAGAGNAFMNLPDIPLSRFALRFSAGKLVASSRNLCRGKRPRFKAKFVGWNGAKKRERVAAKVKGCRRGKHH